jgi:hypothetical protein
MSTAQLAALVLLGLFHGVNPAMGWLFAVSTGMLERSVRALLGVLPFIGLGHAASVTLIAAAGAMTDAVVAPQVAAFTGGALLVGFGLWLVVSGRHLRWVGMKLGRWQLAGWSFLMSSAHGAGLMLLPVILMSGGSTHHHHGVADAATDGVLAAGIHTAVMLLTAGTVALVVYGVVGLNILRRAWVNLDRIWAFALVAAGAAALITA